MSSTNSPKIAQKYGQYMSQLSMLAWAMLALWLLMAIWMPWWLTGFAVLMWAVVFIPHQKHPQRYERTVKYVVVFIGLGAILFSFGLHAKIESQIAFLYLCLVAKWGELKTPRDQTLVLLLGLFTLASTFLIDQQIAQAIAVFAIVQLIFMAMQNIHYPTRAAMKTVLLSSGFSLPLMVVLFVFMPRMDPLWHIEGIGGRAQTGVSDQLSFGQIGELSQSAALAFRVTSDQKLPLQSELYWRGLVLDHFDGQRWTPSHTAYPLQIDIAHIRASLAQFGAISYQINMEATQQPWLFTLGASFPETPQAKLMNDYTVQAEQDMMLSETYSMIYYPLEHITPEPLNRYQWRENTTIPMNDNQQTRALSQQLWAESGQDVSRYMQHVLGWFRQQAFYYTLNPPVLQGNNKIDQFLFGSRRGFCEHYAASFTVMMRMVGIPAHIVAGYQGGSLALDGKSLEVRQMDAHAWSEVWLGERGWVRVDPTTVVAPDRVEQGMNTLLEKDPQLFGSGFSGAWARNQFSFVRQLTRYSDYASYWWSSRVVAYDQTSQLKLLSLLGLSSMTAWLLSMLGLFTVILAVFWWVIARREPLHYAASDKPLIQLSHKLAKYGFARAEHEGVIAWLERLADESEWQLSSKKLKALYMRVRYSASGQETQIAQDIARMWRLVKKWPKRAEQ